MLKSLLFLCLGLAVGAAAGAILIPAPTAVREGARRPGLVTKIDRVQGAAGSDESLLAALRARIAELEARLREASAAGEANPYPNDSPEQVQRLLEDAYSSNNVDWLLQAIERLLRMGKRGYPLLRNLILDVAFKGKFLPSGQDFRMDQLHTALRVLTQQERHLIGFLDYLIRDPDTVPILKQTAMVAGAYYVGSSAPGSEDLKQTLLQAFLDDQGGGMANALFGFGGAAKQMQIFAMAMSGDPRMIAPLQAELKSAPDKKTQGSILKALAYLGDPTTADLIRSRLDPASGTYHEEIDALGRLGTDEARDVATSFLQAIPDNARFFDHAREYLQAGGGDEAVILIRDRFLADPGDKGIGRAIGGLRRFPTKESRATLALIGDRAADPAIRDRARAALQDVDRKVRGELPPEAYGKKGG